MAQNIFKIYDGRTHFLQWEKGRKLIVLDSSIQSVYFSNSNMNHSIKRDVYREADGKRVCNVPDDLLKIPVNLVASAYRDDLMVKSVKFAVVKRPIPGDYVSDQRDIDAMQERRLEILESAINGADGVMHLRGEKDSIPVDTYSYFEGDVITIGNDEYIFNGKEFVEIGNSSQAHEHANKETLDNIETLLDNKVDYTKLDEVIDDTLTKAKESGKFDGKDGVDGYTPIKGVDYFDGKDGINGQDGYTPIKGVDYFDGTNGKDGERGADGISPTMSVEVVDGGHKMTVTDANGDKTFIIADGHDGVDGKDGYTPVKGIDYFDGKDGNNGKDGSDGKDGYTPIKGVDYVDGQNGQDGRDGKDGEDGISPIISVNEVDDGHMITVIDKEGQKSFTVVDGKDGQNGKDGHTPVKGVDYFDGQDGKNGIDGKDGADGFSPVVSVEDIDCGHRVTITDKNGAKQFDVKDGTDGEGGSGGIADAIIDVIALPETDIKENVFYRLMTATWVNLVGDAIYGWKCYCVTGLPTIGEVTSTDMFSITSYYNTEDGGVYGYVDSTLGAAGGIPAGWYPIATLSQAFDVAYNDVITDISEVSQDGYSVLLQYDFYIYKNEWMKVPFAYEKAPEFDITWDGDMTGRSALDMSALGYSSGMYFVKVSDDVLTTNEAIGASVTLLYNDDSNAEEIIYEEDIDVSTYVGAFTVGNNITVVHDSDALATALGIPTGIYTNGVYFWTYVGDEYPDSKGYVSRFTTPSRITKIPSKYVDLHDGDGLALVAVTGNYNDLVDLPTIPTSVIRYDIHENIASWCQQNVRNTINVYSKSEVNTKIANSSSSVDLSAYSTTTEVETMIAEAIGGAIGGSY